MSVTTDLTLQKLTPPGYFNLSEAASSAQKDFMAWFQLQLTDSGTQADALRLLVLSPWLVSFSDTPRVPYLNYLLSTYGIGFFGGTNTQAAYLYALISGAWSTSVLVNIKTILDALCMPPFSWFLSDLSPRVLNGILTPAITDAGFLIYSTAASPATPANTPYADLTWGVPAGWARKKSSALSYSRGYLSGSNIIWSAPRTVADFTNETLFSAAVPLAVPSAGTVCIVNDDGTGDKRSIYYSDGSAWRKNSATNENLGLVPGDGTLPDENTIAIWAPNPSSVPYAIASADPPLVTSETQGYGMFAGMANTMISANAITCQITQIAGGSIALATLLTLFRRIKPIPITIKVVIDGTTYTISDSRAIA